ncbi:hypothetical protein IF1G_02435 [Cordyceps javanica]|uniref:Uncharacterized protein n=1 Tax=Cordyceps javanica TaxID=43265 RepID=A0A545V9F5_9HYPO|nr:hypothetical protein IF1G_02435 [Cordyceps javanica]
MPLGVENPAWMRHMDALSLLKGPRAWGKLMNYAHISGAAQPPPPPPPPLTGGQDDDGPGLLKWEDAAGILLKMAGASCSDLFLGGGAEGWATKKPTYLICPDYCRVYQGHGFYLLVCLSVQGPCRPLVVDGVRPLLI